MKVIFLDIDGVMNCVHTKDRISGFIGIDSAKVELLKQIIDNTGAEVVLSSSWRHCKGLKHDPCWQYMVDKFKEYDIEFHSITPTCKETSYRGWEIQTWFKDHMDTNIESFIILDDDSDLKPYGSRHIQTSWNGNGMEQKHVNKAIKMLNETCKPWFDDKHYWEGHHYEAENRQI